MDPLARELAGPFTVVTGALDPVCSRESFLSLFEPPPMPLMVVIGEETPSRSRAEMEGVAGRKDVRTSRLPGAPGLYEEHPAALAQAISPFLQAS